MKRLAAVILALLVAFPVGASAAEPTPGGSPASTAPAASDLPSAPSASDILSVPSASAAEPTSGEAPASTAPAADGVPSVLPLVATSLTLVSSPNPSTQGASVDLTATITPSSATGTVSFADVTGGGSVDLGSAALSGGTAIISTTFGTIGSHELVATYAGDASSDPATSQTLTHQVTASSLTPTTTAVAVTPNPVVAGSPATITATVAPVPSTGTVEWLIDGVVDSSTPIAADGTASTTKTFGTPGVHSIAARFAEGTLYAGSQSPDATLTVAPPTYTVHLTASPSDTVAGSTTHLSASVDPAGAGTFKLYENAFLISTQSISAGGAATLDRTVPTGSTQYRADFIPDGSSIVAASDAVDVIGRIGTSVDLAADPLSVVSGEGLVTFTATVSDWNATGTVAIWDVTATPRLLGTATLADDGSGYMAAVVASRVTGAGIHLVEARYSGDDTYAAATSSPIELTVSADVGVTAVGVGVNYATFYPYRDSYRDTVALRGTPREPLSVVIRVYNSSGRMVRSWSLATRTTAWAVAWNGRTASGTLLASGRYRVVQTLRDAVGHTRAFAAYTTISPKRLYWYSGAITKYADTGSFGYSGYAGAYRSSVYSHGVVLDGGYCEYDYNDDYVCDAAVGLHRFTLASAVSYSSIRFAIKGKTYSGWGAGLIAIENYGTDSLDVPRLIGTSFTWYSTSAVGRSGHVSGSRVVTAVVGAVGDNEGYMVYQYVKLTYRYALLK